VSIDFTAYDATCQPRLSRPALEVLLADFERVYSADCELIIDTFCDIGLVTPEGVMTGEHGVPSGSSFTQEVDSEVQLQIAIGSGAFELHEPFQVQGDDGVYVTADPERLVSCFEEHGLEVNRDKTDTADNPAYALYLRRYFGPEYTRDGVVCGVYPTTRALNRIVHLERWPEQGVIPEQELSGGDYFAIRTLSILENCKHHPDFEALVRFVAGADRDRLHFTAHGLHAYVKRYAERGSAGLRHQTGDIDDVSGFMNFESVRLVMNM
jgi:hypothetical protein